MKKEIPLTEAQLSAMRKEREWMCAGIPALRSECTQPPDAAVPEGTALCPRERNMGPIELPDGVEEAELRRWCGEHEL